MKYRLLLLFLFFIYFLAGCDNQQNKNSQAKTNTLKLDKAISLQTTTDEIIVLTKTDNGFIYNDNGVNKAILLNFATLNCIPCKAEIPHLLNIQNKYADKLKVIYVLLKSEASFDDVKDFIDENSIEFSVAYDSKNIKLFNTLGDVNGIPYMVIFDKNGNFIKNYTGAIPEEMLEADLVRIF